VREKFGECFSFPRTSLLRWRDHPIWADATPGWPRTDDWSGLTAGQPRPSVRERRWSKEEMLAVEAQLVADAGRPGSVASANVGSDAVERVLEARGI
jgi:hypothetical protein